MTFHTILSSLLAAACLALVAQPSAVLGDPQLSSWFTEYSGRYASLYPDKYATEPVTTWSHGQGNQLQPAYAGVTDIRYDANWIYITSSGMPFHPMGPWYLNEGDTNIFNNYPSQLSRSRSVYRIPRVPTIPGSIGARSPSNLGSIGIFIDGVAMFDFRDAMSYSTDYAADITGNFTDPVTGDPVQNGDGVWNRDAYHNESVTFDPAYAHQAGSLHHYHASPIALRYLLDDNISYSEQPDPNDANAILRIYTEAVAPPTKHSPILGWTRGGIPVYGPYGYDNPTNASSSIVRMIGGYQLRSLNPGDQRTSVPQWSLDVGEGNNGSQIDSTRYGPVVGDPNNGDNFLLGHYVEDYEYRGDVGQRQIVDGTGGDFHLDLYNGRQCVTPEYPGGTYAYFISTAVNASNEVVPFFPYIIGRKYYADPTGEVLNLENNPNALPAVSGSVQQYFAGPENVAGNMKAIAVDEFSGDVTLTWDAVAGGNYRVETTTGDPADGATSWDQMPIRVKSASEEGTLADPGVALVDDKRFYRVQLESLDAYDNTMLDLGTQPAPSEYTLVTVTLSGSSNPPVALADLPDSITFDGAPVTLLARPEQDKVSVAAPANLATGSYTVVAVWDGVTYTGTYTHTQKDNILLLIVDDWGHDHSPWDNGGVSGNYYATMDTMEGIAASGVRFTRAYANAQCSPTRATILTGRQAHRTTVGSPPGNAFNIQGDEHPLPRVFDDNDSPYELAAFGKWHLGGGNEGYRTRGHWPFFAGANDNLADYDAWTKNRNGVSSNSITYATTDQVNEAKAFIDARNQVGEPWFVWMGFHAPHSPFHQPDSDLLQGTGGPGGTYPTGSGNQDYRRYIQALEALDTEIGRLLESVDESRTNIIIIGDNGTPVQSIQAPYGMTTSSNGNPVPSSRAKGTLFEGGIHVPMVIKGPAVANHLAGTASDTLVNSADIFSTVLDMAGLPAPSGVALDSQSIVPILAGTDTADRYASAELFEEVTASGEDGRSIRLGSYPDYKLIARGNPNDRYDTPSYEFYHLGSDSNEADDLINGALDVASAQALLSGTARDAFDACIAKHQALGGGFSDPAVTEEYTVYLHTNPTGAAPTQAPDTTTLPFSAEVEDGLEIFVTARVKPDPGSVGLDKDWTQGKLSYTEGSAPFTFSGAEVKFLLNNGSTRTLPVQAIVVYDKDGNLVQGTP